MIGIQIIGAVLTLHSIFGTMTSEATSSVPGSTVAVANTIQSLRQNSEEVSTDKIEEYVKEFFADEPLLVEIAKCESTMTHLTPAGTIVRGRVNSKDIGLMQINEGYHLERAASLGFDIHSLEGNMAYAKYLFEKEGSSPWKSSSKCWTKTDAYKKLVVQK